MSAMKQKNLDSSFLYGKGEYSKKIYEFLIKSSRVDKSDAGFEDIRYTVKRNQYTSCLSVLLDNPNVVLMMNSEPMPRALKVFAAKDVKEDGKTKVFIDVSEIIEYKNGEYVLKSRDVNIFISYLSAALHSLLYYSDASYVINNTVMSESGISAYSKLVSNVIDYMRIGGVDNVRAKVLYLAAMFYQINMQGKDDTDSVYAKATKISGLSRKETELIDVQVTLAAYDNIDTLVKAISKVIKVESLKIDNFIDKWIFLYGSGMQFAADVYTSFANMLIYAYVGAYLNNQKQIEKFVGKDMVDFTNALFRVGGDKLVRKH